MEEPRYRIVIGNVAKRALSITEPDRPGANQVPVITAQSCDMEWMDQIA